MAATAFLNQQALTNTGLFQEWSYEAFNQIKDIDVSHRIPLDVVVEQLGNYLRTVGLNDLVGISRTHTHFKLKPNEVVQLSFSTSVDDPTIKTDNGTAVAHLSVINLNGIDVDALPIPYMWAYDKLLKQFFPMQFFDDSNIIMKHRFNKLCHEKREKLIVFLFYFIKQVEQSGTEDDIGFYIRYEDLVKIDSDKGERLVEDTDVTSRRQWMAPKTKEMLEAMLIEKQKMQADYQISITHWFFNDQGSVDGMACSHQCCIHK